MIEGIVFLSLMLLLFIPHLLFYQMWKKVAHAFIDPTPEELWCDYWKKYHGHMIFIVSICIFVLALITHSFNPFDGQAGLLLYMTFWISLIISIRAFSWKACINIIQTAQSPNTENQNNEEIT